MSPCPLRAAEMAALVRQAEGAIPAWYAELLTTVPLGGLEIGWPHPDAEPGDGGRIWVRLADEWSLRRAGVPCTGGPVPLGVTVGGWPCGFLPADGDDPVVRGLEPLAARLSDLLRSAAVLAWDGDRDEE